MAYPDGLIELNPALDRVSLARAFREGRSRVQVPDVLTLESATRLLHVLMHETPWGLAWQAGLEGPQGLRSEELRALAPERRAHMAQAIDTAMQGDAYAFAFAQYRILDAYLERWNPGSAQERIIEEINAGPFLELVRDVTGETGLIKADAQATLYAPGQFLSLHDDSHVEQGWRIAYVLNLCAQEWRPDWGGYLNFFDEKGNIEQGIKPAFNTLNLFRVPQPHNVSLVSGSAPPARFAVTGWCRDR